MHSCVFFTARNRVHLNTHVENDVRKGKGASTMCGGGGQPCETQAWPSCRGGKNGSVPRDE